MRHTASMLARSLSLGSKGAGPLAPPTRRRAHWRRPYPARPWLSRGLCTSRGGERSDG